MPKKKMVVEEGKDDGFKLESLFGSKTRVRLLSLLLDNPERSYYVRELTRRIDAQLNSVRRELKNLVDMGIVLEVSGKIIAEESEANGPKKAGADKKKFYRANTQFAFFEELRTIMKKSAVLMNRVFVDALEKKGTIDLLFLSGRFLDNDRVPSDVLIVGNIQGPDLREAIEVFEEEIGREINYTYMPREEYQYRLEVKDRFLESLLESEKVVLIDTMA